MVPKVDMVTFGIDEEINDIVEKIIASGHSRYPVLGQERDEVKGILLAKDMLPKIYGGIAEFSLSEMLREANVVPETKKLIHCWKSSRKIDHILLLSSMNMELYRD